MTRTFTHLALSMAACCLVGLSPALAQVGNSTSPSGNSAAQPGLGSQQSGAAAGQAGSSSTAGSSQLGTQSGTTGADSGDRQNQAHDRLLATCLIVDNEGEIAISKLGQQRAENPEVKQFAERMVKDHEQMLAKLQSLPGVGADAAATAGSRQAGGQPQQEGSAASGTLPQSGSAASDASAQAGGQSATAAAATPGADGAQGSQSAQSSQGAQGSQGAGDQGVRSASLMPGGGSASALQKVAMVKRELGDECLQSKQKALSEKQGAEFDKAFMAMQVAMHMDSVDTLRVFQRHAQGELRQLIDEALPTVTAHLDHAKSTKMKLEGKSADGHEQNR